MKAEDITIYREVQRNAEMAIKALDTIADKVHNEELTRELAKQIIKYSEIKNKALDQLFEAKAQPYHSNNLADMMLVGGIHSKTLLNTSTSHLAELIIQESGKGITEMHKALNHNKDAGEYSIELAKEFMDFEEKVIGRIKRFL